MKQTHAGALTVKLDLPTQDLEELVICGAGCAIAVIGFYMATDTVRHILKKLI